MAAWTDLASNIQSQPSNTSYICGSRYRGLLPLMMVRPVAMPPMRMAQPPPSARCLVIFILAPSVRRGWRPRVVSEAIPATVVQRLQAPLSLFARRRSANHGSAVFHEGAHQLPRRDRPVADPFRTRQAAGVRRQGTADHRRARAGVAPEEPPPPAAF